MIKLAAFPKCFITEISEGRMDLFDWIEMAKQLECDGLELYDRFFQSTDSDYLGKVRRAVESQGKIIPMLCFSPDFTIPDREARQKQVERQLEMLRVSAEIGVSYCRTLSGQKRPNVTEDEGLAWVVESIEQCLPEAEKLGVHLVIENHYKDGFFWEHREFAQKRELFVKIVEAIDSPWFGVQFDPSNAFVAGDDPVELLDIVLPRVMTVHASDRYLAPGVTLDDLYGADGTVGYMDGLVHGVTGEGLNDYDAIFDRISRIPREIWVSIEDGENGMEEMQRSLGFLDKRRMEFSRNRTEPNKDGDKP